MAFLDPVFNPILQPLINTSPIVAIIVLSLVISLIVVLVYKFFTNQAEMKRLKEEQKEYQKKMKELRNQPEEMMKIQKEAMSKNMQYMKHSFKATLITMLPIILIFSWMNGHLAFEPIYPGETYSVTAHFKEGLTGEAELVVDEGVELLSAAQQPINGEASWSLKSTEGEHYLTVKVNDQQQTKKVLISTELKYEPALTAYQHSDIQNIKVNYNKLVILPIGFRNWLGWLGLYIILSIIFSLGLRKLMKVY